MAQPRGPKKSGTASGKDDDAPPTRRGWSAPVARDSAALMTAAFTRKGFADPALVLHWPEIAGAEVARLAVPVKFSEGAEGGTLTLKAEPGAALFLAHETRPLCDRINAWAGRTLVSRLRFVQGPLAERTVPPPRPRQGALPPGDPAARFHGREDLHTALLSLARWRQGN